MGNIFQRKEQGTRNKQAAHFLLIPHSLFLVFAFGLFSTAFAQQGWSKASTVSVGGQEATINALFYNGNHLWLVGADGLVKRSYDEGRTFHDANVGVNAGLNDVFLKGDRMWVVGDEGTILLSTDGGRSFVKSLYSAGSNRSAATDLYSVQFINDRVGFIVGDAGLILRSDDGGVSWREQKSGTDAQLFHLSFKENRGWVVGTGGVILHTYDGGRNWYSQQSGTAEDLNRVYQVTDQIVLITGNNGTLLRTENGGATWQKIPLRITDPLFGISFIDKKTGWVVGYNGHIIRTYDGGRNWVEQHSETGTDLFAVSFHKNLGFAIGRDGLVMKYYERQ